MKDYFISSTPREWFFYLLGDISAIFLSLYLFRYAGPVGEYGILRAFLWLIPFYLLLFFICDLFDTRICQGARMLMHRIGSVLILSLFPLVVWSLIRGDADILVRYAPLCGMGLGFIFLWRLTARRLFASIASPCRIIVVGNTFNGRKVIQALQEHTPGRYRFVGVVEPQGTLSGERGERYHVLGRIEDLVHIVDQHKPHVMVIALDERREVFPAEQFLDWKLQGIEVRDAPDFYEQITGKILINRLRPSWLLFTSGFGNKSMPQASKRLLDIVLSSLLLFFTSPILLVSALLIRLDSRGPILFRQERVGEWGKVFQLYKFRTMDANAEQKTGPTWAKKNDHRITRVGRFLRQTRIDELPQLINVLKGEMSLVGPRPERPFFVQKLDELIPYYKQRLIVKPGITGWAAINYRYCSTPRETGEKLSYDLFYIKHRSLLLDFFIGLKTVNIILFRKGAL
ncbi:MAG: sugar transferase [bacterium]